MPTLELLANVDDSVKGRVITFLEGHGSDYPDRVNAVRETLDPLARDGDARHLGMSLGPHLSRRALDQFWFVDEYALHGTRIYGGGHPEPPRRQGTAQGAVCALAQRSDCWHGA